MYYVDYVPAGFITGCSHLESFLLSNLECFYSTSNCFSILINYIKETYFYNVEFPSWFEVRPLVYNSTFSQYPPNLPLSIIVNKIMIERWNPIVSYEKFYESCAHRHCSYSNKIRSKASFGLFITLICLIGGLTIFLRLATPYLVKFPAYLLMKHNHEQRHQQGKFFVYFFNTNRRDIRNIFDI